MVSKRFSTKIGHKCFHRHPSLCSPSFLFLFQSIDVSTWSIMYVFLSQSFHHNTPLCPCLHTVRHTSTYIRISHPSFQDAGAPLPWFSLGTFTPAVPLVSSWPPPFGRSCHTLVICCEDMILNLYNLVLTLVLKVRSSGALSPSKQNEADRPDRKSYCKNQSMISFQVGLPLSLISCI